MADYTSLIRPTGCRHSVLSLSIGAPRIGLQPENGEIIMRKLEYGEFSGDRLTHYLFRYPAKFHPPVVRALISTYTAMDQTILDPFVGSGTLLVEALAAKRNAVGVDVDPIAVAVSAAKSRRIQPLPLREDAAKLLARLQPLERSQTEYEKRMFVDLPRHKFADHGHKLQRFIPAIPNIEHWFRRYVIVDLAHILKEIHLCRMAPYHDEFFRIVFASIIRNSSNADPVPVSGLEVTAHMKRKDEEGRIINPFALFRKAANVALSSAEEFYRTTDRRHTSRVYRDDSTSLRKLNGHTFDAVITSPPYQGAVDYYRRHKLEMFWLRHTASQEERLVLLRKYIGRLAVAGSESSVDIEIGPLARRWEQRIARVSDSRARSFRHYITNMGKVLRGLSHRLPKNAPAIFVVGHSRWNGTEIPTSSLFEEIAGDAFRMDEVLFYPIRNRYMSYSRHNGADIKKEYVLVLRRS
jgi:16S rRNA G966 N2-methylase RsmD